MQVTVVLPTYNEAENIAKIIPALLSLPVWGLKVLVVDDNSPDGTGQIVESLVEKNPDRLSICHRSGKLGLGTAYIYGFGQAMDAGAEAVAQMDADFSHPPEILPKLLNALEHCDVAMGSRYVPGGAVDRCWPAWRKGLSAFGNLYARRILALPVNDATGGFRVWRRETLQAMPLHQVRSNGYAFQVEMAYIAYRLGFTFQEIPFYFADRQWGKSKMSFVIQREAAVRVWQMLFEYRHINGKV